MGAFGYWMGNLINLRGHREGLVKLRAYYKGRAVTQGYTKPTGAPVVPPLTQKERRQPIVKTVQIYILVLLVVVFLAKLFTIAF